MSDRRILQPGDRAAISEADVVGTVRSSNIAVTVLDGDDRVTYTVPTVLVSWIPPNDEPELTVGGCYRNTDEPNDARRWWYFPESTYDKHWIEPWEHADKQGNHYRTRDELPRRIEKVTP